MAIDVGSLVRTIPISGGRGTGTYRVVKQVRQRVWIVPLSDQSTEPQVWHESRLVSVATRTADRKEQHMSDPVQPTTTVKRKRGRPRKERGPEVPFSLRDYVRSFGEVNGVSAEHWTRPANGKKRAKPWTSNIIIEPTRTHFWYFSTCCDKPNAEFNGIALADATSLPDNPDIGDTAIVKDIMCEWNGVSWIRRFGRRFEIENYEKKIAEIAADGYTKR